MKIVAVVSSFAARLVSERIAVVSRSALRVERAPAVSLSSILVFSQALPIAGRLRDLAPARYYYVEKMNGRNRQIRDMLSRMGR